MERNDEQIKNVWKPLCIVFAALLALSWVFFGFLYSKGGVNFSTLENPEQNYVADGGGAIIGESTGNGVSLMSAKISPEDFAVNGVSPLAESAYQLTATITPDNADDKTVDWTVLFVNPSSDWASGKTVTDYVTVTPTADGALSARVECLKAFGEQIKVIVTSRADTNITAECTLDYARKILDYCLWGSENGYDDESKIVDFGENEIVLDYAAVSYSDMFNLTNGSWYKVVFKSYTLPFSASEEDNQDPWASAWDESELVNAQFSDYTIKDNMLFETVGNNKDYVADISFEVIWNPDVLDILYFYVSKYYGHYTGDPIFSWDDAFKNGMNFIGSNPVSALRGGTVFASQSTDYGYIDCMAELYEWLTENPNTPVWTIGFAITGKHSSFSKTFTVRYNPETVSPLADNLSLDENELVF